MADSMRDPPNFNRTYISMDYTTSQERTRADRIYEWVYSAVGALIIMQIWILVIALALTLPIAGIVGLILLARDLI